MNFYTKIVRFSYWAILIQFEIRQKKIEKNGKLLENRAKKEEFLIFHKRNKTILNFKIIILIQLY